MQLSGRKIGELSSSEIQGLVESKYSEVASHPEAKYRFRVGKSYALDLGYSSSRLELLPHTLAQAFTGVSSYLARCNDFSPGQTILELGAGGGLDTALLAQKVKPGGKVIGLDLSLAMIRRARQSLEESFSNAVFCQQAEAEHIPLRDNSVDWVVSNGIFNLSPEKEKILEEVHRVLKPQGKVICSEIVLQHDPSPEERDHVDDWFK